MTWACECQQIVTVVIAASVTDKRNGFASHHDCFHVRDGEFDGIL
jgi:hypothetical protein